MTIRNNTVTRRSMRGLYFGMSVAAVSLLGAAGVANAADDSSLTMHGITLYGTVDVGVAYQNHGTPLNDSFYPGLEYMISKNSNKGIFSVAPNGLSQSTIGIKGIEEITDGLSAVFKAETGFEPTSGELADALKSQTQNSGVALNRQTSNADGSRAGQAFNGEVYAGLSQKQFGTVTFGRHNSWLLDEVKKYDPQSGSYAFSALGYSGTLGGGAGDTENTRLDKSVKYAGQFGPLRVGGIYQFGDGSGTNDTGYQFDLGTDFRGASIDAVYARKKDAISTGALSTGQLGLLPGLGFSPSNALSGTISDNTAYGLMAMYDAGAPKFYVGYQHIEYENPSHALAAGTTTIGGYVLAFTNNAAYNKHKDLNIVWTGAKYAVTPKLTLAGAYYHVQQNAYVASGANYKCSDARNGACSGALDAASLSVDYHFTKRFDAYAGAMWSGVRDGMANGYLNTATIDPMIGVRYSF